MDWHEVSGPRTRHYLVVGMPFHWAIDQLHGVLSSLPHVDSVQVSHADTSPVAMPLSPASVPRAPSRTPFPSPTRQMAVSSATSALISQPCASLVPLACSSRKTTLTFPRARGTISSNRSMSRTSYSVSRSASHNSHIHLPRRRWF